MKFNFINQTLDLFFPKHCFVCNEKLVQNQILCDKCERKIELIEKEICLLCGENKAEIGICNHCKSKYQLDGLIASLRYNPVIKNLMHNFKYAEFKNLANYMGKYLSQQLSEYQFISTIHYVIPIPLHKVKKRSRGFNQAGLIAKYISKRLNIEFSPNILKRNKFTKSQTKLSKEERKKNVSGAFVVPAPKFVMNKNILLVDDVLTTGSTLNAAASELVSSGTNKIFAATLARA